MADSSQFHEHLSHDDALEVGSDRSFALTFAVVFGLITAYFYFRGGPSWMLTSVQTAAWYPKTWMGLAGISATFFALAFTVPSILHPFNVIWMKFAMVLNMIVSPIVMGLLFFLTVTPMAMLVRIMGKDLLRLRLEKDAKSYWIVREPPGPPPESIKDQF